MPIEKMLTQNRRHVAIMTGLSTCSCKTGVCHEIPWCNRWLEVQFSPKGDMLKKTPLKKEKEEEEKL